MNRTATATRRSSERGEDLAPFHLAQASTSTSVLPEPFCTEDDVIRVNVRAKILCTLLPFKVVEEYCFKLLFNRRVKRLKKGITFETFTKSILDRPAIMKSVMRECRASLYPAVWLGTSGCFIKNTARASFSYYEKFEKLYAEYFKGSPKNCIYGFTGALVMLWVALYFGSLLQAAILLKLPPAWSEPAKTVVVSLALFFNENPFGINLRILLSSTYKGFWRGFIPQMQNKITKKNIASFEVQKICKKAKRVNLRNIRKVAIVSGLKGLSSVLANNCLTRVANVASPFFLLTHRLFIAQAINGITMFIALGPISAILNLNLSSLTEVVFFRVAVIIFVLANTQFMVPILPMLAGMLGPGIVACGYYISCKQKDPTIVKLIELQKSNKGKLKTN